LNTVKVILGTVRDVIEQNSKRINQSIKKRETMKSLSKITNTSHVINADLKNER